MRNRFIYSVILVLCLVSFSSLLYAQKNKTTLSTDEAKSKIKQMNEKWADYMKSGNIQGVADFYTDDAVVLPNNSKMLRGKDALKKHMEDEHKDVEKYTTVDFKTVDVLGGNNLFIEIGKYKIGVQKKNSTKPVVDEGKYVTVWKAMPDGSLKVMLDTDNTDMSVKEMVNAMQNEKTNNEMTGGKEKK